MPKRQVRARRRLTASVKLPAAPPGVTQRAPVIKPNGYEVLHIVANGDARGYQFGLNKAIDETKIIIKYRYIFRKYPSFLDNWQYNYIVKK